MKTQDRFVLTIAVVVGLSTASVAQAQTASPYQSDGLNTLGLSMIGKIYLAGTDTTSRSFQTLAPGYVTTVEQKLPEGVAFTGAGLNQLDPQRLYFLFDYAPRVYYLYEGAGFYNALGATIASASKPTSSILTGNTFMIFPHVKSSISPVASSGSGVRSSTEPLMLGDFVQLPTVKAGQQLSFFCVSNITNQTYLNDSSEAVFYNGAANNPDNYQHLVAFFPDNSQYIIIGFEDMTGGGDKDCNDVMFVVDVGPLNAQVWRNPNTLPK